MQLSVLTYRQLSDYFDGWRDVWFPELIAQFELNLLCF